jgi:hypothetical protein
MLINGSELLKGYVNEINFLKEEIAKMEGAVISEIKESDKSDGPIIASNMETLISQVNTQNNENSKLQNQLSDLIKEKAQTQQTIIQLEEQIVCLEQAHATK